MAKNLNFWYKFAPKGKFWRCTVKVEYRCTTTNLPLCNDTMTVLKITLLHSVSVITNFVILKHDKKTDRRTKKTSHFFVYSRRATHDRHRTWHGDRGGPSHFCTSNFFDPISSFAARGYWKFVGKFPHRGKILITWLFVPGKRSNLKATYRRVQMLRIS